MAFAENCVKLWEKTAEPAEKLYAAANDVSLLRKIEARRG
jgi:hypothetical protein